MGDATDVHELYVDTAAGGMNLIRHLLPTGDLIIGIDARRQEIALTILGRLRSLGDNQAERCALRIVRRVHVRRRAFGSRTISSHRRHRETVFEGHSSN
jgi:hypothetical protein